MSKNNNDNNERAVKKTNMSKGPCRLRLRGEQRAGVSWVDWAPPSGRKPRDGQGLPSEWLPFPAHFLITWISLVAQTVKHLHTMWETRVQSLGWKISWRRKWQTTPVFLPEKSHRRRSLVGYSPWGQKESDTAEDFTFLITSGSSNVNVLAMKEWRLECCLKKRASSTAIH